MDSRPSSCEFAVSIALVLAFLWTPTLRAHSTDLTAQFRGADTAATDNQFKSHFNFVNGSAPAVPLSEITVFTC